MTYANRRAGATTGAWPGINSFGGWKASGSTGRGTGGPYYVQQFMREQIARQNPLTSVSSSQGRKKRLKGLGFYVLRRTLV